MEAIQTDLFKELCQLYSPHEVLIGIMSGRVFDLKGKKVTVTRIRDGLVDIIPEGETVYNDMEVWRPSSSFAVVEVNDE